MAVKVECPEALQRILPDVYASILEYAQCIVPEHDEIRHGDDTTHPALNGGCHNFHRFHSARMDGKIKNIELHKGPNAPLSTRKGREALDLLLERLVPVTQIVEAVFKAFLPTDSERYTRLKDFFHEKFPLKPLKHFAFGVWSSRAIVLNKTTRIHRDLDDACQGFCALLPLGNFTGGDLCLPELGIKLSCPPGIIL